MENVKLSRAADDLDRRRQQLTHVLRRLSARYRRFYPYLMVFYSEV